VVFERRAAQIGIQRLGHGRISLQRTGRCEASSQADVAALKVSASARGSGIMPSFDEEVCNTPSPHGRLVLLCATVVLSDAPSCCKDLLHFALVRL
jgi:hypothetical protein